MNKIIRLACAKISSFASAFNKKSAFCNIAEGTHSGRITMTAASIIAQANLVVKFTEGGVAPANAGDIPVGVCTDCGDAGDILDIALPGCAESSILCVCENPVQAGDTLYTSTGGKVSTYAANGAHKVGIALTSSSSGGVIEADPQNFGAGAYSINASGTYVWAAAGATESVEVGGLSANDKVIASFAEFGGSARAVSAQLLTDESKIKFTLDANGAAGSTKINWIIVKA